MKSYNSYIIKDILLSYLKLMYQIILKKTFVLIVNIITLIRNIQLPRVLLKRKQYIYCVMLLSGMKTASMTSLKRDCSLCSYLKNGIHIF